tara:strand:- start:33 stop:263 length:231 start_codon:yes stop_codon:yes gene_type:complete
MTERKRFPFRYGQKVYYKKGKKTGYVRSYGPAQLGRDHLSQLPGGPIIFEDMVLVEVVIKGKRFVCLDYVDSLERC